MTATLSHFDTHTPLGSELTATMRATDLSANHIAAIAAPLLTELRESVEGVTTSLLGTSDGLHICSLGLSNGEEAARLAALNATMYSVQCAQTQLMGVANPEGETIVGVTMPDEIMTLVSVAFAPVDHLLLSVSANDAHLGMVIHHARATADKIAEALAEYA